MRKLYTKHILLHFRFHVVYCKIIYPPETRFRTLVAHMKAMQESLNIVVNFIQSREPKEDVEDVLSAPVSSMVELAQLCNKVADKSIQNQTGKNELYYLVFFGIFV